MKVAAYTHPPAQPSAQAPDTAKGNYYVSVLDGERVGLLLGPFKNDHAAALAAVADGRRLANAVDPRAAFYAFGTVRMRRCYTAPGVLNAMLQAERSQSGAA